MALLYGAGCLLYLALCMVHGEGPTAVIGFVGGLAIGVLFARLIPGSLAANLSALQEAVRGNRRWLDGNVVVGAFWVAGSFGALIGNFDDGGGFAVGVLLVWPAMERWQSERARPAVQVDDLEPPI